LGVLIQTIIDRVRTNTGLRKEIMAREIGEIKEVIGEIVKLINIDTYHLMIMVTDMLTFQSAK